MTDNIISFKIENAQIIYRNFAGRESLPYNPAGRRNFAVVLDHATAEQMIKDGWNVKFRPSREEDEADMPYIPIAVRFDIRPPRITVLTSTSRTNINEGSVEMLDYADIQTADLIAVASSWEVGGKSGIKAYLKTLFVTIDEDDLERKYAVNEAGA